MAFTDVLKKAFPFLSAAASLGGPLGTMAAALVGNALGLNKAPAPNGDSISNAIALAFADPAQRAALLKAEQDFQIQMQQLGYQHAEEIEAIAAKDRDSARNMQVQVRSKLPAILSMLSVATFLFCIYMIGFRTLPTSGHDALLILLGAVVATYKDVYGYVFGSSAGSASKDATISSIASGNGKS